MAKNKELTAAKTEELLYEENFELNPVSLKAVAFGSEYREHYDSEINFVK